MGRVITNATTLSFARETSLGVLPATPQWYQLEPNNITSYGTTISKEARNPISQLRARRKGVVTDLDSAVEFEADLTLMHLRLFAESFLFSNATGADAFLSSDATATGFTVPALSAAQAAKLLYGTAGADANSLIYAIGYSTAGNNGLFLINSKPVATDTEITAAGLTAEVVAATDHTEVMVAGVRGAAGDLQIDANGDLTSTALDFTTLGIVEGQTIHVGGVDAANQFFNAENLGFARIAAGGLAANKLTLEKKDQAFVTDDGTDTGSGGTALRIDILFGQFVRNVDVNSSEYSEISMQFEMASPNLGTGGVEEYEYAKGNYANSLQLSLPTTGKATITLGFVGTDTDVPTSTRATEAANAKIGGQVESFGSASDVARLRAQDVDETGLTSDFKTATFTLTNNVSAEKVIGNLGARYLNAGNIECDVNAQVLFTNDALISRVRNNTTIGLDWVVKNGDGGVAFDLPTGTLGGGNRDYPQNQTVLLNGTYMAHQEDTLGFTCGISFFPALPA